MPNNSFQILTLRDQARYNPDNIDVRSYYDMAKRYCGQNLEKIPAMYLAWVNCFYQYKTPLVDFTGDTSYFESWENTKALYNSLPRLFNPDYDPVIRSVMFGTMNSSAQDRQDSFILVRDQYVNRCIILYFGQGGDLSGKPEDVQRLAKVREFQLPHYQSWVTQWKAAQFAAQKNRLNNSIGNNFGKWLGLAAGVAMAVFYPPAGIPALASLGSFLASSGQDIQKLVEGETKPDLANFNPNETRQTIPGAGSGFDPNAGGTGSGTGNSGNSLNPNAAGISLSPAALLIGGALLITMINKK